MTDRAHKLSPDSIGDGGESLSTTRLKPSAAQGHDPPEFEPHFDDDCVCSRRVERDAASVWKSSFTRCEWFAGLVFGACLGALILLIAWLLMGEPRV